MQDQQHSQQNQQTQQTQHDPYRTLLEVLLDRLERLTELTMKIDDLNTAVDKLATDVAAIPKPDPDGATGAQLDEVTAKVAAIDATIVPPAPTA